MYNKVAYIGLIGLTCSMIHSIVKWSLVPLHYRAARLVSASYHLKSFMHIMILLITLSDSNIYLFIC